jgi:DNA mismatch endonuclease (patch repair protein)
MADVHDKETRRRNMQAIKNKNTEPEMTIRKALFREGLRYRLHRKDLPGKPDLVFTKYNAAIQVQGCFWHAHGCHFSKLPDTNIELWARKLAANKKRDDSNRSKLLSMGWRVCEVWECSLKGKHRLPLPVVVFSIKNWLNGDSEYMEIAGERNDDGFSKRDF